MCRRDPQAMVERFAPDAIVTDHRGGLGSWRGRDELLAYYAGICDTALAIREDLEIVSERGAVVITTASSTRSSQRMVDRRSSP